MNSANEWQTALPDFLLEAEKLLSKSEECLSHLHLIRNDSDAIDCMNYSLTKLAEKADDLALQAISEFSRHIQYLIANAENPLQLHDQALEALHNCLTLLAWQLELIDTRTGELSLDENEQTSLIATVTLQIPQKDFANKPQQRLHHAS
jgi:chemotaxis protein histidine kinase CheA